MSIHTYTLLKILSSVLWELSFIDTLQVIKKLFKKLCLKICYFLKMEEETQDIIVRYVGYTT